MIKTTYLYTRDKKGKIRVLVLKMTFAEVLLNQTSMGSDNVGTVREFALIERKSGLLDGKLIVQPPLDIFEGKAGRTIYEQAESQYQSIINKQKDKGYVLFENLKILPIIEIVDPLNYKQIDARLAKDKTYINGFKKVMLAKDPKPGTQWFKDGIPTEKWNQRWLISKKLDGVRASIMIVNGEFQAFSRTGKSLNVAFTDIFKDLDLLKVSQYIGEDKMIDGELYIHGFPLQKISGIVALKEYDPERTAKLQFRIFDYADESTRANVRARQLNTLAFMINGGRVKINVQHEVNSYERMKRYHDKWVLEGYEGLIARKWDALYGYDARDERMLKIKQFQDDEFEIIGHKLGLRGAEDMCFICKTEDGAIFEPKPIGDRQTKIDYVKNIDNIIGKMLTVKFFYYSEDGVPILPTGIVIRDYE